MGAPFGTVVVVVVAGEDCGRMLDNWPVGERDCAPGPAAYVVQVDNIALHFKTRDLQLVPPKNTPSINKAAYKRRIASHGFCPTPAKAATGYRPPPPGLQSYNACVGSDPLLPGPNPKEKHR